MHDPDNGQAVPLATLKKDLLIMKQFNINCVRTCHYPPTPEYIDLANELVRLMVLQRSYSANSQSLKAIDQVLRDTLQMVG